MGGGCPGLALSPFVIRCCHLLPHRRGASPLEKVGFSVPEHPDPQNRTDPVKGFTPVVKLAQCSPARLSGLGKWASNRESSCFIPLQLLSTGDELRCREWSVRWVHITGTRGEKSWGQLGEPCTPRKICAVSAGHAPAFLPGKFPSTFRSRKKTFICLVVTIQTAPTPEQRRVKR